MTTHTIELDKAGKGCIDLRIAGTYYRHGIGTVRRGEEGRQVSHGPMIPGPWAYAFGLCTVISDPPSNIPEYIDVSDGEFLTIDGDVYLIRVVRREWIELDLIRERDSLKHEGYLPGQTIRAYDFEPREDSRGELHRYFVEGKIVDTRMEQGARGYLIEVTKDTMYAKGDRSRVFVPHEVTFAEWDGRVELITE